MITIAQIRELTRRIERQFHPERVVLFGSYSQGTATENSDVDLLVVTRTNLTPSERYGAIRKLTTDFPASFDIVVKTPEEYKRWRSVVNNIVYFADKYGKVLYEQGNS
jgi:predicted nucleotidyltransferase